MHRIAGTFPPTRRAAYAIPMSHDRRPLVLGSGSGGKTPGGPQIIRLGGGAPIYCAVIDSRDRDGAFASLRTNLWT